MHKSIIIATLTVASLIPASVLAQGGPPPGKITKIDASWYSLQRAGFETLTKQAEMPGIPIPPGAKWKYGQITRDKNGTSIAQRFATPNDMASLATWYKQSLAQFGWKVMGQTAASITAEKRGESCVVQLMKTSTPGMNTDVYLSLSMPKG